MLLKNTVLPLNDACDIAISALAGQGQYGTITELSQEYNISK
jgi:hypothetical protein